MIHEKLNHKSLHTVTENPLLMKKEEDDNDNNEEGMKITIHQNGSITELYLRVTSKYPFI